MKKILVLAFVSAAFFFGCSADGRLMSDVEPPAWSGTPSKTGPDGEPTPPPSGGGGWCLVLGYCLKIDEEFTEAHCRMADGVIYNNDDCQ